MATDWTSALGFSLGDWHQHGFNDRALKLNPPHASTSSGNLTPDSAYGTSTEGSPPMANTSTPEDKLPKDLFEWVFEKSLETNKKLAPAEQTKDAPKAESKTPVNTTIKKAWNRFSIKQVDILESHFRVKTYLSRQEIEAVARTTRLSYKQVKTWFQNQRAKEKKYHSDSNWDAIRYSYSNSLAVQTSVPQHMPHYPVQQNIDVLNQTPECSSSSIGSDDYYQYLGAWQQYAVNDCAMISSAQPMMAVTHLYRM